MSPGRFPKGRLILKCRSNPTIAMTNPKTNSVIPILDFIPFRFPKPKGFVNQKGSENNYEFFYLY
jgi:hypothetical protein